jgi:RNA polymerase sigma-70 factor (ECF subfamily)
MMIWQRDNISTYTDLELIAGCIEGKSKCQEALYKRFFSLAMSICVRYAPNGSEVMEVVNDGFLKIFDNLQLYDTQRPFKAWLSRIMVNTAIDYYRRNVKSSNMVLDNKREGEENDPEIEHTLSADDIVKLFALLPDTYRITFNLYEVEGYSHEEIGQMLGVTASTSRSNLTRAKKMLQMLYRQHISKEKRCHEIV